MASPPTRPTSSELTPLMLQAAKDLVFKCGLQPNGLEPAQLDLIFLDDHKSKNFVFSYALRRQLGSVDFWALIAELNDERTGMSYLSSYYSITNNHSPGNKRAQLALSATGSPPAVPHASAYPSDHTADRRILQTHGDTITTPNSDDLDQASPNQKLSQSVVAGRQREADQPCSDTPGEPEPKRQKQTSSTTANKTKTYTPRECPGSYSRVIRFLPLQTPFQELPVNPHLPSSQVMATSPSPDLTTSSATHPTITRMLNVTVTSTSLGGVLLDNDTSHGYLHDTSLVQATPLHDASNGTTQAWSGATPAPPGFNANYGTNINISEGVYTNYNNVPEFGLDGSTFGAVHAHAEWNIGPNS
ncbi:hypothetical protein COCCADRAFT_30820 [Bipolaris zeicola 26-R-13]|uniref:Uncharacterized protein n=1 Tax=Cochliobolus carbonum (strain 26-R-13) TaxID=930089 RepID=W6XR32_COCC2|nr:uncharacterized protein COCCADRAFT_30820 [Bipolaris zeicola 26-R-13]EUC27770.1 hypothetical protein COCCADRAFT_30820 [Bipolaris zeicola 26-R-13]